MCVPPGKKGKNSKASRNTITQKNTRKKSNLGLEGKKTGNNQTATVSKPKAVDNKKKVSAKGISKNVNGNPAEKKNKRKSSVLVQMMTVAENRRRSQVNEDMERSLQAVGTRADAEEVSGRKTVEREALSPPVVKKRQRRKLALVDESYDYSYEEGNKKKGRKARNPEVDANNNKKNEKSRGRSVRLASTQPSDPVNEKTTQSSDTSPALDTQKVNQKRTRSKRARKTAADQLMEAKTQEEKEKADTEAANNARDARHINRAAKLREIEVQKEEHERANCGSESEDEPPKRRPRIGKNEVEDVQYPFAWRARVYKKEYIGTDTEHFAVRKY